LSNLVHTKAEAKTKTDKCLTFHVERLSPR
jgi:hypothetical protein